MDTGSDVLAAQRPSPLYFAVMLCVPKGKWTAHSTESDPEARAAVPSSVAPSQNDIDPVGPGLCVTTIATVAVNAIATLTSTEAWSAVSVVVVCPGPEAVRCQSAARMNPQLALRPKLYALKIGR